MSANTIITSIVTGGTNTHTTVAEEANSIATDFVTQGVVGAITLTSGSTAGTGSFAVQADATPDMGVTVKSGQAYITATPSSQDSQVLRARASSDYTAYTINSNSSGSTKYDWIYLQVSATAANDPAADASDVTAIYTSRSSSNSTDDGSPPTYGLLLAVVTVANGASSITNSNITDKRFNTSIGAQNGSLIVTQQATGDKAIVQAAGTDANIDLDLKSKGTGVISFNGVTSWTSFTPTFTNLTKGNGTLTAGYIQIGKTIHFYINFVLGSTSSVSGDTTVTLPVTSATRTSNSPIGKVQILDNSTGNGYPGNFTLNSTTKGRYLYFGTSGGTIITGAFGSSAPFSWATNDQIFVSGTYEAA